MLVFCQFYIRNHYYVLLTQCMLFIVQVWPLYPVYIVSHCITKSLSVLTCTVPYYRIVCVVLYAITPYFDYHVVCIVLYAITPYAWYVLYYMPSHHIFIYAWYVLYYMKSHCILHVYVILWIAIILTLLLVHTYGFILCLWSCATLLLWHLENVRLITCNACYWMGII